MEIGGIGRGVDEALSCLDIALNGLGMLSKVTNARQEYLNEMRQSRARSNSCSPLWRTASETSRNLNGNGVPTKENFQNGEPSKTILYSVSGCHLNKMLQRRSRKNRISPYCRRKPLNTIIAATSCRSSSGTGSPTTSLSSEDGDRGLTPITQLFQEHLVLQQSHTLVQGQTIDTETFQIESIGLKTKTDTDEFPLPVLPRSKSLEDLREFEKPKTKSLSSYVCGCGGVSSLDVSLPRCNPNNSELLNRRRQLGLADLARLSLDSQNIKSEIDSMSLQIQKLDVA